MASLHFSSNVLTPTELNTQPGEVWNETELVTSEHTGEKVTATRSDLTSDRGLCPQIQADKGVSQRLLTAEARDCHHGKSTCNKVGLRGLAYWLGPVPTKLVGEKLAQGKEFGRAGLECTRHVCPGHKALGEALAAELVSTCNHAHPAMYYRRSLSAFEKGHVTVS